jgi:tetratricopeptide (TPR) repeat protein/predicted Ser/Thr protein kinase
VTTLHDDSVTARVSARVHGIAHGNDESVTRAHVGPGDPLGDRAAAARVEERLFGELPPAPQIGRFVVLNKIGAGGLGIVYAAYDPQLDRRVAIKLVHRRHEVARDGQRVLREAQALARLSHPHVVAVHEVGEHDDRLFIAMELVEGLTLSDWARRPHEWRDALQALLDAARGLAAAHRAGIVHRDFKPANVIVGHDGRARVLDFGLARGATTGGAPIDPSTSALDMQLTQSGTLLGTPAYLAPEQWVSGAVDARADQWAFCVTALEVLWGRRPFDGADSVALRARVLAGDIDKPPRSSLPVQVERVLLRGLTVDPLLRHASMDALIDALERAARPPRRPVRWGLLGLGLVIVGAAAGVTLSLRAQSAVDTGSIERMVGEARAAAAAGHYVYPPSDAPDTDTAYAKLVALEAMTGPSAGAAHEQAAMLRAELAGALVELGDGYWARPDARPFAMDFYAAALLFDPEHAHARERAAVTTGELALLRQRALAHDFTQAELGVADALVALAEPDAEVREKKLGNVVERQADSLAASTTERLQRLGGTRSKPAKKPSPSATPTPIAAPTPAATTATPPAAPAPTRSPAAAKALVQEARKDLRAGRFDAAEKALHRALSLDAGSHAALSALSDAAFEQGRYAEAAEFARRAVAIAPKRADYRMQLGDAYFKVLRYTDARAAYDKALALGHKQAAAALRRLDERLGAG